MRSDSAIENACQLAVTDLEVVRVGNCTVTVSLTSDVFQNRPSPSSQAQKGRYSFHEDPTQAQPLGDPALLPLEFSTHKSRLPRNSKAKRRRKERERRKQEEALIAAQEAAVTEDLQNDNDTAFAVSAAEGKQAMQALLSPPNPQALVKAISQLLPASARMVSVEFEDCMQSSQARVDKVVQLASPALGPEDFSLRARSTGLLPGLIASLSSHKRLEDEASSRAANDSALAVAQDVAQHTVDLQPPSVAGGSDLPQELHIAAELASNNLPEGGLTSESHTLTTYDTLKQVNLQKYWLQRYSLWRRFDEGVLMDREGWYSVTPEALAAHQAERLACDIAVDAFCGVGGNAVQLAASCGCVLACDVSLERLLLAKHNADVYGVGGRIDFVCADFLRLAPHVQADAVFMSPPWGGPSYNTAGGSFDVSSDVGGLGVSYAELLAAADAALHRSVLRPAEPVESSADFGGASSVAGSDASANGGGCIACFLPKSTSFAQLGAALPEGVGCEVERNVLNNRLKSVTVYVGQARQPS